ncbi:MAG: tetratricopeptide repeat protein [Candidatus Obscuribacterales bacterium]
MPKNKAFIPAAATLAIAVQLLAAAVNAEEFVDPFRAFQLRHYKQAASGFEKCLKDDPNDAHVCYYAAQCYQNMGRMDRALLLYRRVFALSPDSQMGDYAAKVLTRFDKTFKNPKAQAPAKTEKESKDTSKAKAGKAGESKTGANKNEDQIAAEAPGGDVLPNVARVNCEVRDDGREILATINSRALRMVLDTTTPVTQASKFDVNLLSLTKETRGYDGMTVCSDRKKHGYWLRKLTIQVGPIIREKLPMQVIDARILGSLGQDFYKDFDLTHDDKSFIFTKKGFYTNIVSTGNFVPFEYIPEQRMIIVYLEINGKKKPVRLGTGKGDPALLFKSASQCRLYGVTIPKREKEQEFSRGESMRSNKLEFESRESYKLGPLERRSLRVTVNPEWAYDQHNGAMTAEDMQRARKENELRMAMGLAIRKGDKARQEQITKELEELDQQKSSLAKDDELKHPELLPVLGDDFLAPHRYTIDMEKQVIHFSLQ